MTDVLQKQIIHTRCPVEGFTVDIQHDSVNPLGSDPGAEHIEDCSTWVEVIYDGSNPFVLSRPYSCASMFLYAKNEELILDTKAETDFDVILLKPQQLLRAIVVSETINRTEIPLVRGIARFFLIQEKGGKLMYLFGDTIQPIEQA